MTVDAEARKARQPARPGGRGSPAAYASVAKATFDRFGTTIAPDATFTLRLAVRRRQSYRVDERRPSFATTLAGLYERSAGPR